jgi:hypothetical protein
MKQIKEIKEIKKIQKLQKSNDLSKILLNLDTILALQDKTSFELNSLFA